MRDVVENRRPAGKARRPAGKARLESKHVQYQQALERDDYTCTVCGSRDNLVVHHIDGRGRGCKEPNHTLENLETLCNACHCRHHTTKGDYDDQVKELLGTMSIRAISRTLGINRYKICKIRDKLIERGE